MVSNSLEPAKLGALSMKRFCLIGVLCLLPGLLVTGLVAQEEFMAEPAKHTIKVFEDPQNGAIYWPLGVKSRILISLCHYV